MTLSEVKKNFKYLDLSKGILVCCDHPLVYGLDNPWIDNTDSEITPHILTGTSNNTVVRIDIEKIVDIIGIPKQEPTQ